MSEARVRAYIHWIKKAPESHSEDQRLMADDLEAVLREKDETIKMLAEALEFYGDDDNYELHEGSIYMSLKDECGNRAREALKRRGTE